MSVLFWSVNYTITRVAFVISLDIALVQIKFYASYS
jgi:hypothetical protein